MAKRRRGFVQLGKDFQPGKRLSYEEVNAGVGPQPIVCCRCADGPSAVPSVRDVCVRCLAVVWVSRETDAELALMRQPELWCMECLEAHLKESPAEGGPGG